MRSPFPPAARHLLTLIAASAAVALTPASARAQADPFAIPDDLTAQSVAQTADQGPLLVEIVVDGRKRSRMVHIDGRGDALTIDAADARAAGLPVTPDAGGAVRMADLKIYRWSFDKLRQQLEVLLLRASDGANFRDFAARSRIESETHPLLALRLDYDLTATISQRGVSAGGLVDGYVARGNFSIGSSGRVLSNPQPGSSAFVRLETQAQLFIESQGLVAVAGDLVSAGSQSQRPVRMGGLQLATDTQLRPDLVMMPLPAFSGSVSVPTTIDLVSAGQNVAVGKVEPGEFTVRNIPMQAGRGELSAVLRDSLGREVVQTTRFYVSRDLLAPRRTAYAVNAGFVRRRFGITSNDYGPLAATAYVRRGLSPSVTLEASGEWSAKLINLGARADFTIAKIAKATIEGRLSRDGDAGSGTLFNIGLESIGPRFGVSAGATLPSATYRDVASRLGDPLPPRQLFVSGFVRVRNNTQIQFDAVRRERRADPILLRKGDRTDSLGVSLQTPVGRRMRLYGSTDYRWVDGRGTAAVAAGLSLNLGGARHAGLSLRRNGSRNSASARYTKDDVREGDISYRLDASLDDGTQRVAAGLGWRGQAARLDGEIEEVGGRFAGRFNARGTLMLAGGTLYARNTSNTGYALVRAGTVGGIPVTLENQLVGRTNRKGRLLVQDIPALTPVKIDVDPDKLPAEALVKATLHTIRVPARTVALVEIDAVRFIPVMRLVTDATGTPLPAGMPVTAYPSGGETLTGFDGMVEINAGAEDTRLVAGWPGRTCVVELRGVDLTADIERSLTCTPMTIAAEDTVAGPKLTAKAARRKHAAPRMAQAEPAPPRR